jgi:hypothetical protein
MSSFNFKIYQYWPDAWHFQKVGNDQSSISEIMGWARNPFPNLVMVNEAWSPHRVFSIFSFVFFMKNCEKNVFHHVLHGIHLSIPKIFTIMSRFNTKHIFF